MAVSPRDEVDAFGRAFDSLCRAWVWWIVLGSLRVSGVPALGIILALVVLFWLVRLQRATTGVVARYLRACVAVSIVATVMLAVATIRDPDMIDSGGGSRSLGFDLGVIAVGLLLFCRAMQLWLRVHDGRGQLLARWHRSEVWTRVAVVGGAIYLAALSVGGPALDDIRLGTRWGLAVFPLAVLAAVVGLGSLLSVGNSAGRTRDALQAYSAP